MIVFLACAGTKLPLKKGTTIEAYKLYGPSPIFAKRFEYAKSITDINKIYILSAKYGLVNLNDQLEYYDLYLGDQSAEYKTAWQNKVIEQMKAINLDFNEEVYFAAGKEYYEGIRHNFTNSKAEIEEVKKELGKAGIGMALHYYDVKNSKNKEGTNLWSF